jgi:hypothetical protein
MQLQRLTLVIIDSKSDEVSGTFDDSIILIHLRRHKRSSACTKSVATVSETDNGKRYAAWDKKSRPADRVTGVP